MNVQERHMRSAMDLARKATQGLTNPNPMVGAVVVKGQRIVGKGYHRACGLPHAEANALKMAGKKAKGATLYVTLEPCDHFGRTPPCTDAIVKSRIRKVVIGMKDPNPINRGKGIAKLNSCGMETVVGVLEDEAQSLNRPYIKFITKRMPYVTVKIASSLDGKIATKTGDSKWITSRCARRYARKLRSKVDAVMVGVNTVINDDPLLLSKSGAIRQPLRIIVDSRLKTPLNSRIFSRLASSPVIIATLKKSPMGKRRLYEAVGARVLAVKEKSGRVDLKALLRILAEMDVMHLLVEGGGELIASLIEGRLADRFLFFIAPKIIGGRRAVTAVEGPGIGKLSDAIVLKYLSVRRFARDILIEAEAS